MSRHLLRDNVLSGAISRSPKRRSVVGHSELHFPDIPAVQRSGTTENDASVIDGLNGESNLSRYKVQQTWVKDNRKQNSRRKMELFTFNAKTSWEDQFSAYILE
eukprot:331251_1